MACRCVQYNVDCGPTYFRMINLFKQFSPTAVSEEVLPICICKAKACVAVDCRGGTVGVLQSGCGGKVRGKRLPGTKGFSQPPNPNHKYDMYCLCCGCACGPFGNLKLPAKKTHSWRKIHVVICSVIASASCPSAHMDYTRTGGLASSYGTAMVSATEEQIRL